MSSRYDLTAQVEPFLDPELFKKIEAFNKGAEPAKASPSEPVDPSTATLEAAQQLYASGKYSAASEMLNLLKAKANPMSDEFETIVWGKLAADLLAHPEPPKEHTKAPEVSGEAEGTEPTEESEAVEDDVVVKALTGVQEMLDLRRASESTVQLNRRAWLIHWSLFAYFPGRLTKLVDTYFTSQYMSVIHAACPWILRYIAVAVIVSHPRTARFNRRVKDITRAVQQELYEYCDPVLEFVQKLYIDYDFSGATDALFKAKELLKNDYFAHELVDQFVESGRILIADSFLRVHEFVPASDLALTLSLSKEESSTWIQNYIQSKQEAKLDSVYDEAKQTVRVSYSKPSIYTQVVDKVKNIDQRAHQIQQQQRKTE